MTPDYRCYSGLTISASPTCPVHVTRPRMPVVELCPGIFGFHVRLFHMLDVMHCTRLRIHVGASNEPHWLKAIALSKGSSMVLLVLQTNSHMGTNCIGIPRSSYMQQIADYLTLPDPCSLTNFCRTQVSGLDKRSVQRKCNTPPMTPC